MVDSLPNEWIGPTKSLIVYVYFALKWSSQKVVKSRSSPNPWLVFKRNGHK